MQTKEERERERERMTEIYSKTKRNIQREGEKQTWTGN
jgi:hypothetical protein